MNEIDEIKRRIDIIDLVSSYVTIKKAGANFKAICPFHQEKTPSMMVSPEKQIFKCFGCNEGGDIFSFVMKMENMEFSEALKILADRTGVKLTPPKPHEKAQINRKSRLFHLNSMVAKAFHKLLIDHPAGKVALKYLKDRGLTIETIKQFMLGYAPLSRSMNQWLKKKSFIDKEIEAAGRPDKFFKRIIFPIRDVMGNILGFTGRVLDPKQEPKYLNTPETIIFYKGRILYNLDQARGEIKQKKATVVVEGQMDVISSWQTDVKNVVATSGTALTKEHLQILYRYTPNIIFAFDSDSAGLASAKKAYEMAIIDGFNVKMVDLKDFKDPGEMIIKDPKLWQKQVSEAQPVIDWYFQMAFRKRDEKKLTPQIKKEIAKEILPLLVKVPDAIEQAHYVGLLAKKLGISEEVVFDALKKQKTGKIKEKPAKSKKVSFSASELLLGILFKKPAKIKNIQTKIKDSDFKDQDLKEIYNTLKRVYNEDEKNVLSRLKKKLNRQLNLKVDDLILIVDNLDKSDEEIESDFTQVLLRMDDKRRENLKNYYAQEIKKAENERNFGRLKKLIKEFQDAISE